MAAKETCNATSMDEESIGEYVEMDKQKHIFLIDYENVQPARIEFFNNGNVRVYLFVGNNSPRKNISLLDSMKAMGKRAKTINLFQKGKNALDFLLAFYAGKIAQTNPGATFHIVSKDKGYDSLIAYMNQNNIKIRRTESLVFD